MKVLHVITSLRLGGAERMVTELATAMNKNGHDVEIAVFDGFRTPLTERLESEGIIIHSLGNCYLQMWNPLHIFKLKKLIGRHYDIVHTHNYTPQLFLAFFKKIHPSTSFVTTEHSPYNRRRSKRGFILIDRWMYSKYDKVISVSNATQIRLLDYLEVPESDKFQVIYNGVDLSRFLSIGVAEHEMHEEVVLTMVARFRKEKDHVTLLKAMTLLPEHYCLWLVGDGAERERCWKLAIDLGISHRVHFLGERSNIPEIIGKTQLVILSSHYEGMPLAALEGMASGRPLIASNVIGLNEVCGDAAIMFEHQNPADLAMKIQLVSENPELYETISQKCKERAGIFDIRVTIREHEKTYCSLINPHEMGD